MSSKPISDYARAIKRLFTLEGQYRALQQKAAAAARDRDLAERQVRDLTHELQLARRENAQLRSLVPDCRRQDA
jgi:hypothetical protein